MKGKRKWLWLGFLVAFCPNQGAQGAVSLDLDRKEYPIPQNSDFKGDCQVLGFDVGEDWGLYMYGDREEEYAGFRWDSEKVEYMVSGVLNHATHFYGAFLQNFNCSEYFAVIYKVVCTPLQARKSLFGPGDNWYFRELSVNCDLGNLNKKEILNWAPKTMPSSGSSSVTAGVNLGTDTSASIQFSMSANWSELKFTSKTYAATGVYGATWYDGSCSDYTKYSSEYLGAFIFQYKGDPDVYLYMDAKYYGTYSGAISKDSKRMVF